MGDVMKEVSFFLVEVKFILGDINYMVLQNVNKVQLKVRFKKDNVVGIIERVYLVGELLNGVYLM